MTVAAAGEMCRLTICGPSRQVEVAVPAHVVVSDLLPVLVEQLGENLVESGLLHGGWVLQRLGAAPLDQGSTVAALGLHDGDMVHLRPRAEQIPPVDFDDLIDGIATGVQERPGRWQPSLTRWAALAAAALLLATGVAALGLPGHAGHRALAAGGLALACLVGSVVATFAVGERPFGVAFAVAAVGYAGLAGLLAADPRVGVVGLRSDAPALFTGAIAVVAMAGIAALTIAHARLLLLGVVVAGLLTAGATALGAFAGLGMVESAAALLVASTLAAMMVPLLAFRLAGLRLAPLPTKPEHLQEELDPIPSTTLLPRAATADRLMSALYSGLAAPTAAGVVIVGAAPGWAPATLAGLVVLVRCLAARPMTSGWHRLAQLLPAAAGGVTLALACAASGSPLTRAAGAAIAVPLGVALLLLIARILPGRRPTPYWGRAGDLLQTLAATAILPVFLAVLDVYGLVRGIGG
ncbi:type VII secretion integral membrane protein EccD [Dactylosporangium sp. AC04546]|uniref:type VII secretion integral membrane protein EccD n=1 Tax=Dactylosporangium sp. AC04546 TaxID=2862460 RepID=UPI001EDFB368|nr:type VII secretion integral membrane protein EccD [Dactylosporangium sp. AC04546]WVK86717.1 type VII secretion integral membrane protein EccD [Dactylosporangium sp. AC04546]